MFEKITKNTFKNAINGIRYAKRVSLLFIENKFFKLNICAFVKELNVEDFESFTRVYSLQKNSYHLSLCMWI